MAFLIFDFQLVDSLGRNIGGTGGAVTATLPGSGTKVAVYDPVTFALLGGSGKDPVPLVRGHVRFAVADTVTACDLMGFAPGGQWFEFFGRTPNDLGDGFVDTFRRHHIARIPWSVTDSTAATEKDTGFDLPVGAVVSPFQAIHVTSIDATEDLTFGTLSTQTGGDADGFGVAAPVGVAGTVALKSAATATRGALIGAGTLDRGHVVTALAPRVSYTTSAGSDTGVGFMLIPYDLAA
jgi:hypothetical protein